MGASLQKLVTNLAAEGKDKFQNMMAHVQNSEQQYLLLQKGVYLRLDEPSKFAETKLPPQEDFYSQLQEEGISDEHCTYAQNVWDVFHCNTFGEYHDLYLKIDVLLLADVFENFRNVCLTTYELNPSQYYTAPGLSWDAMLKHTHIQLELIDDIDMYQMVEKGIRGGISVITHKHAKANNPYVPRYD